MISPCRGKSKPLLIQSPKILKKKTNRYFLKGGNKISLSHLDIPIQNCILSLLKESSSRTSQDLSIIHTYLESSDLAHKLKAEKLLEESLHKTLSMCSYEMKHLFLHSNTTLFRIGDKGDNFYIILHGRISILKPIPKKVYMTGFEYFRFIKQLYITKEHFIMKQTIDQNKQLINIDINDMNDIHLMVFRRMIKDYFGKYNFRTKTVNDVMNDCFISTQLFDFEIDNDLIIQDVVYRTKIEKMIMRTIPKFDIEKMDKYQVLLNGINKIELIIYEYQSFLELGQGAFFGDVALDKHTTRNATIKTVEDTHFCFLHCQHYNSYLKQEKQRIAMKEINFLWKNFFFDKMQYKLFEKVFANFILEDKKKKDILINEGSKVKYIYFIKEGLIELNMTKSLNELYELITNFCKIKNKEEFNLKEIVSLPDELIICDIMLHEKINMKLLLLSMKGIIGIDCIGFESDFLYTARVVSDYAKVYKIEKRLLDKLLITHDEISMKYMKSVKNKMEILLNRLINVFNNKIKKKKRDKHEKIASFDMTNKVIKRFKIYSRNNNIHVKNHFSNTIKSMNIKEKLLHNDNRNRVTKTFISPSSTSPPKTHRQQISNIENDFQINKSLRKARHIRTSAFCIEQENYMFNKIQHELQKDKLFITKINYKMSKLNPLPPKPPVLVCKSHNKRIISFDVDKNSKLYETYTDPTTVNDSKGITDTYYSNGNNDIYLNSTTYGTNPNGRNVLIYNRESNSAYKSVNYRKHFLSKMFNVE